MRKGLGDTVLTRETIVGDTFFRIRFLASFLWTYENRTFHNPAWLTIDNVTIADVETIEVQIGDYYHKLTLDSDSVAMKQLVEWVSFLLDDKLDDIADTIADGFDVHAENIVR